MSKRDRPMSEALVDCRRREDAAPRLIDEIRGLRSMRLRFSDVRAEGRMLAQTYTRPIVVTSAPAYFEIRCMEPRCDGWHDITQPLLRGLRESRKSFAGESNCQGMMGDMPCDHTLAYVCDATYAA